MTDAPHTGNAPSPAASAEPRMPARLLRVEPSLPPRFATEAEG